MAPLLLIAGGGTGGHVFPGIAIAEAWHLRHPDGRVVFAGSARGIEARIVPQRGYRFEPVPARRLKNATASERLINLAALPAAVASGVRVVRRIAPDVVLGVGGYVSGPVVLGAALTRRPCAIAEQNALPGLTNRLLARVSRRIYTAFPEAGRRFPSGKVRLVGNPVRAAICARAGAVPDGHEAHRLLVLGGSQGAGALNRALPPALGRLGARLDRLEVRHQAGEDRDEPVRAAYRGAGIDARVEAFIDDMAEALAWADLVVARAGATTVAELACVGKPALFVPFPHAADDHQTLNARSLVDAGAALMLPEAELGGDRLVEVLGELLGDPSRLAALGRAARGRGRPEAAAVIVEDLTRLTVAS